MVDFKQEVAKRAEIVNNSLDKFFEEKRRQMVQRDETSRMVFDAVYDYTMRGGKRLRPVAMMFLYEGLKGKNQDDILSAGLAIEFIQNSSIVHDDLMDEDVLRRGKPTVHVMCGDYYLKKRPSVSGNYKEAKYWFVKEGFMDLFLDYKNLSRFGKSGGIIGGNILLGFAYESILKSQIGAQKKLELTDKLNDLYLVLNHGQTHDIGLELVNKSATEEEYLKMVDEKTGALFMFAAEMAVILTNSNDSAVNSAKNWAKYMARAFQIQDDILGSFGSEEQTGKPNDSDIKEGKKTLLVIKAYENASTNEKTALDTALGNRSATAAQIEQAKSVIKESGSLEYSQRLADEMAKTSIKHLKSINLQRTSEELLMEFSQYVTKRHS